MTDVSEVSARKQVLPSVKLCNTPFSKVPRFLNKERKTQTRKEALMEDIFRKQTGCHSGELKSSLFL